MPQLPPSALLKKGAVESSLAAGLALSLVRLFRMRQMSTLITLCHLPGLGNAERRIGLRRSANVLPTIRKTYYRLRRVLTGAKAQKGRMSGCHPLANAVMWRGSFGS